VSATLMRLRASSFAFSTALRLAKLFSSWELLLLMRWEGGGGKCSADVLDLTLLGSTGLGLAEFLSLFRSGL
jgi:hypothetical protein